MQYLRRNILDIEVKVDKEFPKPEEARFPISAITLWDSYTNHYYSLVLHPNHNTEKISQTPDWDIYYCGDERSIGIKFIKLIQALNPDTLEGFFSRTFDFPYIFNRLPQLDLNLSNLSPLGYVSNKSNRFQIAGRHILDIVDADKKFKNRTSYSLKNIAEEENLPIKKQSVNLNSIHETPEQLAEYNKTDVEVTVELDKKMQHIKRYASRWQMAGLEDIDKAMSNSIVVDTIMLREAKKMGIVLPSKPEKSDTEKQEDADITGGMVFTPIIGVHNWVADDDQSRFYPNLIYLLRMSSENISNDGTLISANGTKFIDNPNAFLPRIIAHFFKERDKVQVEKAKLNPDDPNYWKTHEEDENIKFLLNSVPGTFGQKSFRLYEPLIIDSITTSGQALMKRCKSHLESMGIEVVYGDTDAIHRKLINVNNLNDAIKQGKETNAILNQNLPLWAKEMFNVQDASSIKIVFEKVFRRIIYILSEKGGPVKKRYAARLVWEKGKPTDQLFIRGFEYRRSDTAKVSKNLQYDIFKKILYVDDILAIKKEIIEYVQNIIKEFSMLSLSDIAIPYGFSKSLDRYGGINKNGNKKGLDPEVRGALYSNTYLKTNFGADSKVKLLYINIIEGTYFDENDEIKILPPTDVICFEDESRLPKLVVNYSKMIDLTIRKKIERILQAVNISWNEIEGIKPLFDID